MPADGHGLLPGEADEAVGDVHRLLPVAVGKGVVKLVGGHLLPLPGGVILHVAEGFLIAAHLAQVVEQGHHRHRLLAVLQAVQLLDPLPLEVVHQAVVYVQAVLAQPALAGQVVPGGGGGGEKVAFVLQIIQKGVRPGACDLLFENLNKFLFAGHDIPSRTDRAGGRGARVCCGPALWRRAGSDGPIIPQERGKIQPQNFSKF